LPEYCYLPLYVFCGRHLLLARQRRANVAGSAGAVEEVARIVAQVRQKWPRVRIILRAAESYLDRLARRAVAALPVAAVPDVNRRAIDRTILQSVVRAIREIYEIEVLYRSPRSDVARRHRIFPYALLHDGFRWWGELVLDRIEEVFPDSWTAEPALIGGDAEWQTVVEIELVPNPDLEAAGRSLIEEQYGMKEGGKIVRVRQCMLAYFLKRYHLEEPITLKAPHQAPLRLRNRGMAGELLPPGMRVPLEETDALAPKLMRRLQELLPLASEQAIMERALASLLLEIDQAGKI